MNFGFFIILAAQFLSALADNSLLFAAIALLQQYHAPAWHTPLLQEFFVIAYILLAPFVGPFADALPKGRVMFISNTIKFIGCIAMLTGIQPLYAYGVVGIGAAAYSPAKYGILTEYLPPRQLVVANSWMEGTTVLAIILGAIIGGVLVSPTNFSRWFDGTLIAGHFLAPQFAILIITALYFAAGLCNLYIPHLPIDHKTPQKNPLFLLHDFWHVFRLLWRDPLGMISLAVTTLFWGVGATMRLVVIVWAGFALQFNLERATQLTAVVAVGVAIGAIIAGRYIKLEHSVRAMPAGIAMGITLIAITFIHDWRLAAIALLFLGVLGGFFVVPMNALLQHRGHLLMGAGHSIAVQNFNENIGILIMIGIYTLMVKEGLTITTIMMVFGLFISASMAFIYHRHQTIIHQGDH